ncbi:MAG: RDD family protein [Steroidobacteraceae bacterium]
MTLSLDNVVRAETPEGILLELRPAGLQARCYAWLVDQLIRLMLMYVVFITLAVGGFIAGLGLSFWLIFMFALEWFYPVVFEIWGGGATPGKRVQHIRVVMDDGLPVTPAAALTRNLLRAADFLPAAYGAAILCLLLRADFRRLGDLAAGTLVVHVPRTPRPPPPGDAPPLAPAIPLTRAAEQALVALAARAPRLTPARLDELAALAAPAAGMPGAGGAEVTRRVLGIAQWLLGRR